MFDIATMLSNSSGMPRRIPGWDTIPSVGTKSSCYHPIFHFNCWLRYMVGWQPISWKNRDNPIP